MISSTQKWLLSALFAVLPLVLILGLSFGDFSAPTSSVLACLAGECEGGPLNTVLFEIRLPHVLIAFFAGGALALAGAVLQGVTRNPLADPYLFGVVSGAALGVVLLGMFFSSGYTFGLTVSAFIGALGAIILVVFISKTTNRPNQMILVGVALSFLLSALSQFFLYLQEPMASNRIMFWLLGSLSHANFDQLAFVAPISLLALVSVLVLSRQLDALALSDELAESLGVQISGLKTTLLVICALMTAVVVSTCGGIAFVGLMIPHIVRQLMSGYGAPLLLATFILGGIFLVLVDVVARQSLHHVELPLGVVTSALGSLFFLLLLLNKSND